MLYMHVHLRVCVCVYGAAFNRCCAVLELDMQRHAAASLPRILNPCAHAAAAAAALPPPHTKSIFISCTPLSSLPSPLAAAAAAAASVLLSGEEARPTEAGYWPWPWRPVLLSRVWSGVESQLFKVQHLHTHTLAHTHTNRERERDTGRDRRTLDFGLAASTFSASSSLAVLALCLRHALFLSPLPAVCCLAAAPLSHLLRV